jgi:c(7)-type cytochrome triheme protein
MLPKDDMDQADWVEALEQGIIRPREAIGGPRRGTTAFFKFDFFLPGPDPSYDAFFPHSAHTEWLSCESCHPKIFRVRGTEITMDEVFGGEYCGKCHGTVAFGLDACARCHTAME